MPNANHVDDMGQSVENESGKRMLKKAFNPGIWTTIFTGFLVVFSGLLYEVSHKANETSIVSQRAFVNFSGPAYAKDTQGKILNGVNIYYGITNSGTTPAKNAVSQWNFSLGPIVPDRSTDFEGLPQSERISFVLGPKAFIQLKPVHLSVQDLEAVGQGKEHLFFWGWTTYHDIFPGTPMRLSEFCTEIDSLVWTNSEHTNASTDLNTVNPPCPTHNCYDEDCSDYQTRTK